MEALQDQAVEAVSEEAVDSLGEAPAAAQPGQTCLQLALL